MSQAFAAKPMAATLYDTDFHAWTREQAALLKAGKLGHADIVNIIEELESLGRNDRREIKSRLVILLMHLLKWQFQPGLRTHSWRGSIREQRRGLASVIEDSPSLKSHPATILNLAYDDARAQAADETSLSLESFPEVCPYAVVQILDPSFLPGD